MADEQAIGLESWISLEYLALRDSTFQPFVLKCFIVSLKDGAEEFSGLNDVLAKLEVGRRWVALFRCIAWLHRRDGKLFHNLQNFIDLLVRYV